MGQIRSCFTTFAATVLVAAAGMLGAVDGAEAQYRRPSFLEQLFGGGGFQQPQPQYQQRPPTHTQPQQTDSSRAPPPRKSDKTDTPPSTTVMVFGDSFADWLGYGLEDSFSDTPEVGVVRKNKTFSGLIRYEARGDLDWPNVVRDTLGKEKADFVVIMLGLSDRQAIREAPRKKDDKKDAKAKDEKAKDEKKDEKKDESKDSKGAQKDGAADDKPSAAANDADDEGEQPNIAVPERTTRAASGSAEFRSDRWAELYSRKIDEMIAAAKSRGVPVIWVGLPSIRGTRSTADALYLNDLYRSRAQKAGIVYVDVWDGFVDENNRYSLHGPDVEGQTRRLRAYDGVHFTSYGARKLAHYVDREIRRLMSGRGAAPIALPSGTPAPELAAPSGPAARPLAGPVVSLTGAPENAGELAGSGRATASPADPVAAQVLVKGEPVAPPPGRADNFAWPRALPGTTPASTAPPPAAAAPAVAPTASRSATHPANSETPDARGRRPAPAAAPERRASGEQQHPRPPATTPRAPQRQAPPPPPRGGGLFDLFR